MNREQRIVTLQLMTEKQRRIEQNKLNYWATRLYDWESRFHSAGSQYRQRLLMAANRVGKTLTACIELAFHLTGLYPPSWEGVTFLHPTQCWALGVSGEQIRDVLQKELFGRLEVDSFSGDGLIPIVLVGEIIRSMTPRLSKDIRIKHISGGWSILSFKSYSQGQHVLMGSAIDFALIDEEPKDPEIYPQVLTRTATGNQGKGGSVVLALTPENGMTELVTQFMTDLKPGQYLQTATWDDAPHLTDETKEQILAAYPPYQREMRTKGVPLMGEGLVFLLDESCVKEEAHDDFPYFWPRIIGIDFGWDHPTAVVWIAYDIQNDIMHIYDCFRQRESTPVMIAGVIRTRGQDWIPIAWPHDGLQHSKDSGEQLAEQYRQQGLEMMSRRATFEDGSNGLEAGVMEMYDRIRTGRLKVASHLSEWFEEYRMFHRKKNKIVALKDDLLSATRYAMMMLRYASTEPQEEHENEEHYQRYNTSGMGY